MPLGYLQLILIALLVANEHGTSRTTTVFGGIAFLLTLLLVNIVIRQRYRAALIAKRDVLLRAVAASEGDDDSEEIYAEALETFDIDKDGKISFDEMVLLLQALLPTCARKFEPSHSRRASRGHLQEW
eukprot:766909-Prymnesium_polylepis.1